IDPLAESVVPGRSPGSAGSYRADTDRMQLPGNVGAESGPARIDTPNAPTWGFGEDAFGSGATWIPKDGDPSSASTLASSHGESCGDLSRDGLEECDAGPTDTVACSA